MADGGQDIHVVEISFFRNLTERGAEGLQVDAYHLADGISGHGCEVRVLFPVPRFLQCLMMVVAVYYEFQFVVIHGSDVLKVQHSLGGTEGIGGELPLPCLVSG